MGVFIEHEVIRKTKLNHNEFLYYFLQYDLSNNIFDETGMGHLNQDMGSGSPINLSRNV
jgi:hypothetical protein